MIQKNLEHAPLQLANASSRNIARSRASLSILRNRSIMGRVYLGLPSNESTSSIFPERRYWLHHLEA